VSQSYRLKLSRPSLKLKVATRIPAQIDAEGFLTIVKANGVYTLGVDYTQIGEAPITDAATAVVVVLDESTGTYKLVTVAELLQEGTTVEQHITGAGPVSINNNTGIVRVNQTVGAAMTLTMGLSSAKTCPVLISDWKGDAGTNNITINLSGSDEFPGGLTSWTIAADTGSIFLRPISGVGYAL